LFLIYFNFHWKQRTPAKQSKPSATSSSASTGTKSADGEVSWLLDKMRYVKVREFKGKTYVDIREYYEKDGKEMPGKKGISLSATQWRNLCSNIDDINKELSKF